MKTTRLTIDASKLRNQVSDLLGYVQPLHASEIRFPPIVDVCGDRVEICDGYHRIAGLIAGGAETQPTISIRRCTSSQFAEFTRVYSFLKVTVDITGNSR